MSQQNIERNGEISTADQIRAYQRRLARHIYEFGPQDYHQQPFRQDYQVRLGDETIEQAEIPVFKSFKTDCQIYQNTYRQKLYSAGRVDKNLLSIQQHQLRLGQPVVKTLVKAIRHDFHHACDLYRSLYTEDLRHDGRLDDDQLWAEQNKWGLGTVIVQAIASTEQSSFRQDEKEYRQVAQQTLQRQGDLTSGTLRSLHLQYQFGTPLIECIHREVTSEWNLDMGFSSGTSSSAKLTSDLKVVKTSQTKALESTTPLDEEFAPEQPAQPDSSSPSFSTLPHATESIDSTELTELQESIELAASTEFTESLDSIALSTSRKLMELTNSTDLTNSAKTHSTEVANSHPPGSHPLGLSPETRKSTAPTPKAFLNHHSRNHHSKNSPANRQESKPLWAMGFAVTIGLILIGFVANQYQRSHLTLQAIDTPRSLGDGSIQAPTQDSELSQEGGPNPETPSTATSPAIGSVSAEEAIAPQIAETLAEAQRLIQQRKAVNGLNILAQIPDQETVAQAIDVSLQQVAQQAKAYYEEGLYREAKAVVTRMEQLFPKPETSRQTVLQSQEWEAQWEADLAALKAAQTSLDQGQYDGAIATANTVTYIGLQADVESIVTAAEQAKQRQFSAPIQSPSPSPAPRVAPAPRVTSAPRATPRPRRQVAPAPRPTPQPSTSPAPYYSPDPL